MEPAHGAGPDRSWVRLPADLAGTEPADLPAGRRVPRGMLAARIDGSGDRPRFHWPARPPARRWGGGRLRFAVALDFREERKIEAVLAGSGASLGIFDVRYAYAFQPFELVLGAGDAAAALREGVRLHPGSGSAPLWIFDDRNRAEETGFFAPHLLLEPAVAEPRPDFLGAITSFASVQPFGWLEGCVLDGLQALLPGPQGPASRAALDRHLRHFLDDDGTLVYEDLRGQPADGRFTGIESTLPLAVIAARQPDHPLVARVLEFWRTKTAAGGIICDGTTVSAEGAYTVGYPLAVIAAQTGRADLAAAALRQITGRIELLPAGSDLFLRSPLHGGGRTFRNWARAYAWYLLGLVRTGTVLEASMHAPLPELAVLRKELRRIAAEVRRLCQPEGLWTCFLDQPETGVDTSGSAGIAAALALGAGAGWLPPSYGTVAADALSALQGYLTADGLLTGVAQHNAGGLALQSGGYRVLSQMGLGLLAQLHAAVSNGPGEN